MKNLFENKNILITGASRGLGMMCAIELAKDGANLALLSRTIGKNNSYFQILKNKNNHLAITVDLTKNRDLEIALNKAIKHYKKFDVVLHVAGGGLGLRDPLLSSQEFYKLADINIIAAIEINRIIIPSMIECGYGNLVHVCSIASDEATGSVGYNTVKAALAAYVRSLGRELAKYGIIATGILPGGFMAPDNSWARLKEKKSDIVEKFVKEKLPRGYLGESSEIIPLIKLLCSEQASMMGGCLVPIDAGEGFSYLRN